MLLAPSSGQVQVVPSFRPPGFDPGWGGSGWGGFPSGAARAPSPPYRRVDPRPRPAHGEPPCCAAPASRATLAAGDRLVPADSPRVDRCHPAGRVVRRHPQPLQVPSAHRLELASASRAVKRAVQVWTGDRSSYGSSTERRYAIGEPPKPSSLAAVRPPEVEKKNVCATSTADRHDLAARGAHRSRGGRDLGQHAAVDLRAHVGEHVPRQPGGAAGERVGAGDDRLRRERLGRPARRHLGGHDAVQVVLERDVVDRQHAAAVAPRAPCGRGSSRCSTRSRRRRAAACSPRR